MTQSHSGKGSKSKKEMTPKEIQDYREWIRFVRGNSRL
jgi:hypothetical protein